MINTMNKKVFVEIYGLAVWPQYKRMMQEMAEAVIG